MLPLAIGSVLNQTYRDFELVISNGGSNDGTAEVVRSFSDPRIRYIEAPARLSIGENYQSAYNQANGEYITFLSDDDAFVPQMLERVNNIILDEGIEILVFRSCFFFQDPTDYMGHRLPANSVFVHDFTGELFRYSGHDAACGVFGNADIGGKRFSNFCASFLANAIYHRSVFKKISEKNPQLFDTTPADGFLAAAVGFVVDRYHFLDEPLHVWTNWAENASASPERKGSQLRAHYEHLLRGTTLEFVPLKIALPMNCYCNAILKAKSLFDMDNIVKIDWRKYYSVVFRELMHASQFGLKVNNEIIEFHEALEKEPAVLKRHVLEDIRQARYELKRQIYSLAPTLFRAVKRRVATRKKVPGTAFTSKNVPIHNVLDAANKAGKMIGETSRQS